MPALQLGVFLIDDERKRPELDEDKFYQELRAHLVETRGVLGVVRHDDAINACIALTAEISESAVWEFMRSIERFLYQKYDLPQAFEIVHVMTLDAQYAKLVAEYVGFRRVESAKFTGRLYECHVKDTEKILKRLATAKESVARGENYSKDMEAYLDELHQVTKSLKMLGSIEHLYSKSRLVSIDDGWGFNTHKVNREKNSELRCT